MSFMVVNTGRAASRAFYLNLKNQPSVYTCSRYRFDKIVTKYVTNNDPGPLKQLAIEIERDLKNSEVERKLAITFHGARPRLEYPFDHEINRHFLSDVYASLGIDHVFMVVRQPSGLMRSELNRQIAGCLGDWSFATIGTGWSRKLELEDLRKINDQEGLLPIGLHDNTPDFSFEELTRGLSERTGKPYSMYNLFKEIFPNVHIVSYEAFVTNPISVFERMAKIVGFGFENPSLTNVKLNGLANRFLCYNPVYVSFLKSGIDGLLGDLTRLFIGRDRTKVRLRFEIEEIIEKCDDWGDYKSLDLDVTDQLPHVREDLGVKIGLGVEVDSTSKMSGSQIASYVPNSVRDQISGPLSSLFQFNYLKARSLYQDTYLSKVPSSVYDIFWNKNYDQYDALEKLQESEPIEFRAPPL